MGFWIQGTQTDVNNIQQGAQAANALLQDYNISGYQVFLAHKRKLSGKTYNKKMDAVWREARNACFENCFGERCLWEPNAHMIYK